MFSHRIMQQLCRINGHVEQTPNPKLSRRDTCEDANGRPPGPAASRSQALGYQLTTSATHGAGKGPAGASCPACPASSHCSAWVMAAPIKPARHRRLAASARPGRGAAGRSSQNTHGVALPGGGLGVSYSTPVHACLGLGLGEMLFRARL